MCVCVWGGGGGGGQCGGCRFHILLTYLDSQLGPTDERIRASVGH